MMTIRIGFFILLYLHPNGLAFAQVGDGQEGFRRSYSILLERNIFSRDRRPYVPERERSTYEAPPPPPIESTLVLLGIGRQRGQTLAFVEDTLTGRIERHAVSGPIARGHVQLLTLDFLVYARDAKEEVSDPNAPAEGETARVRDLADGRVFTGRQAVANGLIDAIGGEAEARDWLAAKRDISKDLPVFDVIIDHPTEDWLASARVLSQNMLLPERLTLDGLISLWHPGKW